jgi:hypothetical protein
MKRLLYLSIVSAMVPAGCSTEPPPIPNKKDSMPMNEPTILKTIEVLGFDPEGEPAIRVMSDGTLVVVFNFMPPSYAEGDEMKFRDFDKQLERALGVPVHWEDREIFMIRNPQKDSAEKAKVFLESYRKMQRN